MLDSPYGVLNVCHQMFFNLSLTSTSKSGYLSFTSTSKSGVFVGRFNFFRVFAGTLGTCCGWWQSFTTFQCLVVENEARPQTDRYLKLPPVGTPLATVEELEIFARKTARSKEIAWDEKTCEQGIGERDAEGSKQEGNLSYLGYQLNWCLIRSSSSSSNGDCSIFLWIFASVLFWRAPNHAGGYDG